ncbi:MAG: hypothetical protein U9Q27_03465 [Patescibacteria group bacterium]|nr:hypothetical protein [Patescibacteria group bacterium]
MDKKNKKCKYNKDEFINILCKKCNLCRNIGNPTFCYDVIYKNSFCYNIAHENYKRRFTEKIFSNLLMLKNKELLSGILICNYDLEDFKLMFKQTFCNTNIHKKNIENCPYIFKCMTIFRLQLYGIKSTTKVLSNNYKIRKKNKYIVKPYPTFFTNDRNS